MNLIHRSSLLQCLAAEVVARMHLRLVFALASRGAEAINTQARMALRMELQKETALPGQPIHRVE